MTRVMTLLFALVINPSLTRAAAEDFGSIHLSRDTTREPQLLALELQGDPGCDYTTPVYIGDNLVNLIVDTGSSNFAVAAAQCKTCNSVPSPRYDKKLPLNNKVGVTYGTAGSRASWAGIVTTDIVKFPNTAVESSAARSKTPVRSVRKLHSRQESNGFKSSFSSAKTLRSRSAQQRPFTSDVQQLPNEVTKISPDAAPLSSNQLIRNDAIDSLTSGFNGTLAAITENVNFFNPICPRSQGIWGMAYSGLAVAGVQPLFDTMVSQGVPDGFAIQLCHREQVLIDDRNLNLRTGNLWLGGVDTSKIAEPFRYVPIVAQDWYQVHIDAIEVNGVAVTGLKDLNKPKSIVDSGTTDIILSDEVGVDDKLEIYNKVDNLKSLSEDNGVYLIQIPSQNYQALVNALASSHLIRFSSRVPKHFITDFWFKGNSLRLPAEEYFVSDSATISIVFGHERIHIAGADIIKVQPHNAGTVDIFWAGFSPGGSQMDGKDGVGTILGATLFLGKVVFFDRTPRDGASMGRIGFAAGKDCTGSLTTAKIDLLAGDTLGQIDGDSFVSSESQHSAAKMERPSIVAFMIAAFITILMNLEAEFIR